MLFFKLRKYSLYDFVRRQGAPILGIDIDAPQHHVMFGEILL